MGEGFKLGGKAVAWILLAVAVITGVVVGLIFLTGTVSRGTADYRGKTSQIENNQANGAFRQATYEEFFNLCSAVQTTEDQIDSLNQEIATGPTADRVERINSSITAIRNSRAASINTYNSKATQEHREAFLDAKLPYRLDVTAKDTTCAE